MALSAYRSVYSGIPGYSAQSVISVEPLNVTSPVISQIAALSTVISEKPKKTLGLERIRPQSSSGRSGRHR